MDLSALVMRSSQVDKVYTEAEKQSRRRESKTLKKCSPKALQLIRNSLTKCSQILSLFWPKKRKKKDKADKA